MMCGTYIPGTWRFSKRSKDGDLEYLGLGLVSRSACSVSGVVGVVAGV